MCNAPLPPAKLPRGSSVRQAEHHPLLLFLTKKEIEVERVIGSVLDGFGSHLGLSAESSGGPPMGRQRFP